MTFYQSNFTRVRRAAFSRAVYAGFRICVSPAFNQVGCLRPGFSDVNTAYRIQTSSLTDQRG
jgi:hypothetical protein